MTAARLTPWLWMLAVLLLVGFALRPRASADPNPPAPAAEPELVAQVPAAADELALAAAQQPAATFAFPADGVGGLLAERLTPPRQLPLEPVPYVAAPQAWEEPTAQRALDVRLGPLASAAAVEPPRLHPAEAGIIARAPRAVDTPPLAFSEEPPAPARSTLPLSPLRRGAGWAWGPIAPAPSAATPYERPVTATTDPTRVAAFAVSVPAEAPAAPQPTPPEAGPVDDPLAAAQRVRPRVAPADTDLAPSDTATPARVLLPVAEPPETQP